MIIALGLLVDDAMIAVEMMVSRLEVGDPLNKAASFVYTSTAFPMLTGTLVTVASFLPIGLNSSKRVNTPSRSSLSSPFHSFCRGSSRWYLPRCSA